MSKGGNARATATIARSTGTSTALLSYVQEERAAPDRRTGQTPQGAEALLKKRREFERGEETIIRVTKEAKEKQEDLLSRFRAFVDARYERLEDSEIASRLKR